MINSVNIPIQKRSLSSEYIKILQWFFKGLDNIYLSYINKPLTDGTPPWRSYLIYDGSNEQPVSKDFTELTYRELMQIKRDSRQVILGFLDEYSFKDLCELRNRFDKLKENPQVLYRGIMDEVMFHYNRLATGLLEYHLLTIIKLDDDITKNYKGPIYAAIHWQILAELELNSREGYDPFGDFIEIKLDKQGELKFNSFLEKLNQHETRV